jgi:transcriptional regulator with XRE-family HTH domain
VTFKLIGGNYVRKFRVEQGLSALELSYRTRIAPSMISAIENGKTYPYKGWRKKLSKVLGVPETELFSEVD